MDLLSMKINTLMINRFTLCFRGWSDMTTPAKKKENKMYKLVRPILTLIFGALVITSVSLAATSSSASAVAAAKGREYTNSSGGHVCICEDYTECQPCAVIEAQ